jgi:hypothetical protein
MPLHAPCARHVGPGGGNRTSLKPGELPFWQLNCLALRALGTYSMSWRKLGWGRSRIDTRPNRSLVQTPAGPSFVNYLVEYRDKLTRTNRTGTKAFVALSKSGKPPAALLDRLGIEQRNIRSVEQINQREEIPAMQPGWAQDQVNVLFLEYGAQFLIGRGKLAAASALP